MNEAQRGVSGLSPLDDRKVIVPSPWRIRNDGRYVVVYECAIGSLKHRVLSPLQAMLIPFLDGTVGERDLLDLACRFLHAHRSVDNAAEQALSDEIRNLRGAAWISNAGPPSPSFCGDRISLVADFAGYKAPSYRLDRPLEVTATVTHYCRTDCIYCYAERKFENELSLDEWVRVFDEARANEIFKVDITGGDVFARPDAIELLTELVSRDFIFFTSTKCPIDARLAARLSAIGVGRAETPPHLRRDLQISVDSTDPALADCLVGRRGYLGRATDSVKNCVAAGLDVRVKGVLTSLNADDAEKLVGYFVPLGVRRFHFVQYGRTHFRHRDELFLSRRQKAALREQHARIQALYPDVEVEMQYDAEIAGDWATRNSCSGGRLQMVIKPNGDVTLCDQIPQSGPFVVANVLTSGLIGAWTATSVDRFLSRPRDAFKGKACFDCPEFTQCHSADGVGYCFRDSLFVYGDILEAPPSCPRQTKVGLRQI